MPERVALLLGGYSYTREPRLQGLRAPPNDLAMLESVLGSPEIGRFAVERSINETADNTLQRIAAFLAERQPEDVVLLYFSGHGIRDFDNDDGKLYLAATNTHLAQLPATALRASDVNELLHRCLARQKLLILDCCHSGAFGREDSKATRGIDDGGTRDAFADRGLAVLSACDDFQYVFADGQLQPAERAAAPSCFTRALVEGLFTGSADRDGDGWVTLDELYRHVDEQVRSRTPAQAPRQWMLDQQGRLVVGRVKLEPAKLRDDLAAALGDSRPWIRKAAVEQLLEWAGEHPGRGLAVAQALERLSRDVDAEVKAVARSTLQQRPPPQSPDMPLFAPAASEPHAQAAAGPAQVAMPPATPPPPAKPDAALPVRPAPPPAQPSVALAATPRPASPAKPDAAAAATLPPPAVEQHGAGEATRPAPPPMTAAVAEQARPTPAATKPSLAAAAQSNATPAQPNGAAEPPPAPPASVSSAAVAGKPAPPAARQSGPAEAGLAAPLAKPNGAAQAKSPPSQSKPSLAGPAEPSPAAAAARPNTAAEAKPTPAAKPALAAPEAPQQPLPAQPYTIEITDLSADQPKAPDALPASQPKLQPSGSTAKPAAARALESSSPPRAAAAAAAVSQPSATVVPASAAPPPLAAPSLDQRQDIGTAPQQVAGPRTPADSREAADRPRSALRPSIPARADANGITDARPIRPPLTRPPASPPAPTARLAPGMQPVQADASPALTAAGAPAGGDRPTSATMGSGIPAAPPTPAEYPHLQVLSGAQAGTLVRLTEGGELSELTVGSQVDRDVRLEDAGVSDLHARLIGGGARWKVVDLTSAGGTYVNGRRIDVSFITAGDRLRFGSVECVFHAPSARSHTARRAQVKEPRAANPLVIAALVVVLAGAAAIIAWLNPGTDTPASPAVAPQVTADTGTSSVAASGAAPGGSLPGSLEYERGREVYGAACEVCHGSGVAGAPKLGDAAAWATRIAQGSASLRQRALNGYQGKDGFMPAKGGRIDLSDQAVIEAVDYIVANSK